MFAIKSHQEFKEDWFYPISSEEKKKYEALWSGKHENKFDTAIKNERLCFKFRYTLNDNDNKKKKWKDLDEDERNKFNEQWEKDIKADKIVQEDISVTRNRPFYVFQVD